MMMSFEWRVLLFFFFLRPSHLATLPRQLRDNRQEPSLSFFFLGRKSAFTWRNERDESVRQLGSGPRRSEAGGVQYTGVRVNQGFVQEKAQRRLVRLPSLQIASLSRTQDWDPCVHLLKCGAADNGKGSAFLSNSLHVEPMW